MRGLFDHQTCDVPKEQREAMARSYGEQGTKELMKILRAIIDQYYNNIKSI